MSVNAVDILNLRNRYVAALDNLHDDYVHTRQLWRDVQVRVGRYGETLTIKNPVTGSSVDGAVLANKAMASIERLSTRSFKDIVAQFELYTGDLLQVWLTGHPELITEKALNVSTLLSAKSLGAAQNAAIVDAVESTIVDKMYGKAEKWLNYLKKNLGSRLPATDELAFVELKARRDVLEHHNGRIDAGYIEKAKEAAAYETGDAVVVTGSDVDNAYQVVRRLIQKVSADAIAKLSVSTIGS